MNLTLKNNLSLAERQQQEARDYVKKQTENAIYLSNPKFNNPCHYERQLGRSFTPLELDARLKKLNPNLLSEVHPHKSDKRCLYWLTRQGKKYITTYENGFIPEHSIWAYKEEEVPDTDFMRSKEVGGYIVNHINKKDIPKSEYSADKGLTFEDNVNPGYTKVSIPYMEAKRGWRTVLTYIVKEFIATPTEVESIFGSDDSAGWARNMGKSKVVNLW